MDTRRAFALAFRQTRKACRLTQEDFGVVSSRTYVSSLERAMKSPTLDKLEELARAMDVHPLTLLALTFVYADEVRDVDAVLEVVRRQVVAILEGREPGADGPDGDA